MGFDESKDKLRAGDSFVMRSMWEKPTWTYWYYTRNSSDYVYNNPNPDFTGNYTTGFKFIVCSPPCGTNKDSICGNIIAWPVYGAPDTSRNWSLINTDGSTYMSNNTTSTCSTGSYQNFSIKDMDLENNGWSDSNNQNDLRYSYLVGPDKKTKKSLSSLIQINYKDNSLMGLESGGYIEMIAETTYDLSCAVQFAFVNNTNT